VTKYVCTPGTDHVAIGARLPTTCSKGKVTHGIWESTVPNFKDLGQCQDPINFKVLDKVVKVLEVVGKVLMTAAKFAA
jgi:hypothetical protein